MHVCIYNLYVYIDHSCSRIFLCDNMVFTTLFSLSMGVMLNNHSNHYIHSTTTILCDIRCVAINELSFVH